MKCSISMIRAWPLTNRLSTSFILFDSSSICYLARSAQIIASSIAKLIIFCRLINISKQQQTFMYKQNSSTLSFAIIMSIVIGVSCLCQIKEFDFRKDYGCNTNDFDLFENSDFPVGFDGSQKLTIAMWFQTNYNVTRDPTTWYIIFQMTFDETKNTARVPSTHYGHGENIVFDSYYTVSESVRATKQESLVHGTWYFITATTNYQNDRHSCYIYDESNNQFVFSDQETYTGSATRTYSTIEKLYVGAYSVTHTTSCTNIAYPAILVDYTISQNEIPLFAYGFQSLHSILLSFSGVYLREYAIEYFGGTYTIFKTYDAVQSFWTPRANYNTSYHIKPNQWLDIKPNTSFPFRKMGVLQFGARLVFKPISFIASTGCNFHWIFRRLAATTTTTRFGLGFYITNGTLALEINGNRRNIPGLTVATGRWFDIRFTCLERDTETYCVFFDYTTSNTLYRVAYGTGGLYPIESDSDKIRLGGAACAESLLYKVQFSQVGIPERTDGCYLEECLNSPAANQASCLFLNSVETLCAEGYGKKWNTRECIRCPAGCLDCEISISDPPVATCTLCSAPAFEMFDDTCACIEDQLPNLADLSSPACSPKPQISATLKKVSSAEYKYNLIFNDSLPAEQVALDYIRSRLVIYLSGTRLELQNLAISIVNRTNFQITFEISDPIPPGTRLMIEGVDKFNEVRYSPINISPTQLTADLEPTKALSPSANTPNTGSEPSSGNEGSATTGPSEPDTNSTAETPNSTQNTAADELQDFRNYDTKNKIKGQIMGYLLLGSTIILIILPLLAEGSSFISLMLLQSFTDIRLFRFIDVPFTVDTANFFQSLVTSYSSLNFFSAAAGSRSQPELTCKDGKYGALFTSFVMLDNAGWLLLKEFSVLALLLVSTIIVNLSRRHASTPSKFEKLIKVLQRGSLVIYFLADFPEVAHFTSLQIQQGDIGTAYVTFSLMVGFAFIFGCCLLLLKLYQFTLTEQFRGQSFEKLTLEDNSEAHVSRSKNDALQWIHWMNFMSKELKLKKVFDKIFLLVLTLERLCTVFVILLLQGSQLTQLMAYIVVSIAFGIYILTAKPFFSKMLLTFVMINQAARIALGIILLLLDELSRTHQSNEPNDNRQELLVMVIIGILVANMFSGGILIYKACANPLKIEVQNKKRFSREKHGPRD